MVLIDPDAGVQRVILKYILKTRFALDTERIGDYAPRSDTDLGEDVFKSST
jgi:hypothetical protein